MIIFMSGKNPSFVRGDVDTQFVTKKHQNDVFGSTYPPTSENVGVTKYFFVVVKSPT